MTLPVVNSFSTQNMTACAHSSAVPGRGIRLFAVLFIMFAVRCSLGGPEIGVSAQDDQQDVM